MYSQQDVGGATMAESLVTMVAKNCWLVTIVDVLNGVVTDG